MQCFDDLNMFRCQLYLFVGSFVYLLFFGTFAGGVHLYFDLEHFQCGKDNGIFRFCLFFEDGNGFF